MTKEWFKAALIRALKTFAQTFASMLTVGAVISDINWKIAISSALVAGLYSIATSFAGLPEVGGSDA